MAVGVRTRAAEGKVFAARETLRVIEQSVLLSAASVYMDVLRDTATLDLQRENVRVLRQTLKVTQERLEPAGARIIAERRVQHEQKALAKARETNRPIFAVVSWGSTDDQSC